MKLIEYICIPLPYDVDTNEVRTWAAGMLRDQHKVHEGEEMTFPLTTGVVTYRHAPSYLEVSSRHDLMLAKLAWGGK